MLNEVKFATYVDTNEHADSINLDDFIRCKQKLYFTLSEILPELKRSIYS